MPFDWTTPFGYFFAFLFQTLYILYATHLVSCYFTLLFGSCYIMTKFADDFGEELKSFDKYKKSSENLDVIIEEPEEDSLEEAEGMSKEEMSKETKAEAEDESGKQVEKKKKMRKTTKGNPGKCPTETMEKYKRIIEFHSELKRLSKNMHILIKKITVLISFPQTWP